MGCESKIVEKAIDVGLDLTIRQVGYIINYRDNVSELDGLVNKLELARNRVNNRVHAAKNDLGTIEGDVSKWFQEVDEITEKTVKLKEDVGRTETTCSSGLLPYLRNRHRLGRKAKKIAADVKLLIDKSQFDGVSYEETPMSMDTTLSNDGYEEFDSRKDIMEKIMAKLEDSTVRMIGVHGQGGVGKSTLINEIAKKALDEKLFKVVIRVDVTDNPNLPKIQEEIAYVLGLRLEGESETVRADRLRRRLKKQKENTLIILDDLWDRLDLNKIGISFEDERDDDPIFEMEKKGKSLGDYKGCKVLLTSRDKKVLSDIMDMDDKSIFCVQELDDKESLMLFQKVAEMPDEMSTFKHEIVKKYCSGLPMAIFMVGRALRNKSESVWKSTLEKLKKEELNGVQKSMEISVRMSYDHLESEELKSIFSLCAQMGHQQLIMDLVKYCFGLGILQGVYTIREAHDRIFTSIQKLKNSSLMFDGSSNDRFDMHDMVRDAALSISHKEQNVFAFRNGKLDDWPDKDKLEKCTAISICNCDIIDELPEVLNCPQIKFFQIESDDPSLKIPENFFEAMKKLRVLILTGFDLSCLPPSIECLVNLRMLCLERCILHDNLSVVGKLKKLRILSFSGSQIENLPAELGCLDKVQLFDISNCSITNVVPPNFISRLVCLEELYIRKSLIKMEVHGETNESQISFLSQLKHLHQLRVVDLYIPSAAVLPRNLFFDRLDNYKIVIGDFTILSIGDFRLPNKYEASRSLALHLTDGTNIHSRKRIKLLLKRVENLLLGELNGVQNVFCELNVDGFPDLKHLSIINNTNIEYIINSMELSHPQVFPILESLFLYKLKTIKILCYSPVIEASFTKLKTIKVKMCAQLKNLFSCYMVKFLTSLESIDVSVCDSLEEIVVKEVQAISDKVEFQKLRFLTLQSLPSLSSFYANVETPSVEEQTTNRDHTEITIVEDDHSVMDPLSLFGELKLKVLLISECRMMERIFITEGNSVEKVSLFPKLEEIRLTKLDMLTDIWQAKEEDASGSVTDTQLQGIHIEKLPKLKQVWDRDPGGILSFKNLQIIWVEHCNKIRYVLPASVAKNLKSLESISVANCGKMEEIVAWEDESETPLEFPEVILVQLFRLPIRHFYRRGHIECPKLKQLSVVNCEKLETFATKTIGEERKPVFDVETVISNLEMMIIDSKEALWLQSNLGKYLMHRLKDFTVYSLSSIESLYWLLHRMPNLESFKLCSSNNDIGVLVPRRNIVPQERLGTILQLKKLCLMWSNVKDLRLERDPILQRVENFVIYCCDKLTNLAPPSVSLTHLTYLEVNSCYGLRNLMASSTARSMVQLRHMKIISCHLMEVVTDEENKEDREIEVVFSKLISIELVTLKNLKSFCSYKNCEFKFPSLERFVVRECPELKTFTKSHTTTPKLQSILLIEGEEEEKGYWEGDLNATIQKIFKDKIAFKYTEHLVFSQYHEMLTQVWDRNDLVQQNMFCHLKTLKIEKCSDIVHVIPSHLLPCFENLEELTVRDCSKVEVIFNINDMRVTKALETFHLKKLYLTDLPNLKHVWDKDPIGIFCLKVLQEITVDFCGTLKSLFPASVAKDLTRLEMLKVTNCKEMVEIFSKDEIAAEGAILDFVFPCLTSLHLKGLTAFRYFYHGLHKIELPVLNHLCTCHCNFLINCQEDHPREQDLTHIEKVIQIPSLEILSFDIGDAKAIWHPKSSTLQFDKLQRFQQESGSVLYRFLVMLRKIEKLVFRHGLFEEMFSVERPNADYNRVLLNLKELELIHVCNLNSIGFEHSWIHHIPENLQTFKVLCCCRLVSLVPHTVSFSNLTNLHVIRCRSLLYLLTSSTAKSLCQLKEMRIEKCESMQEIVSTEGEESHEDEKILFGQLHTLFLKDLPKLRCFYSGIFALCFPSLERVFVISCMWMETFSSVNTIDPTKLSSGITFTDEDDDGGDDETPAQQWEGDLNSTLKKRFEEMVSFKYTEHVDLSCYPDMFERVWHPNGLVQENMFCYLKTLKIEWCNGPVEAVPSHLLPCFANLEELSVRSCSKVEVIFNINDMRVTKALGAFRLKILSLYYLPKLEYVWDKDPIGIFCLPMLQEIRIDKCDTLKSLFPASVAKDLTRLEVLSVTNCTKLVEIFSEDEIATEEAIKEFVIPCLTSLELRELPALTHFYPGLHKVEWPLLKELHANCSNLVSLKLQEDHLEGKTLIQIEKVIQIPSLEILSFGIGDTEITWNRGTGELQLEKLQSFQDESDSVLYELLGMLPNIEKLQLLRGSYEEMFSAERPNGNETRVPFHLKELELAFPRNLKSIGFEHSWLHPVLENVQIFKMRNSGSLRSLIPHKVSFSNLAHLHVTDCNGLLYLFTSSTAKSLYQLKEMRIEWCESMQEIVSTEGDERHEDEKIIFGQLVTLFLYDLPTLSCFYSGNLSLCFPSLEEVFVIRCRKMKTFCPFNKVDPTKLSSRITFRNDDEDEPSQWKGDLNSTLCNRFEEQELQMPISGPYDMIKDLNDSELLWEKIAVRIVRIWYIQKPPKPGHLEMILMDSKGDKIQVAVKNDEFIEWNERLKENTTYVIDNFMLLPNGLQFKSCEHPYIMQFTNETTLREEDFPDIPFYEYQFKSFSEILAGKYQPDLLVDVIGLVDEIEYSPSTATSKKVMLKMKDLSGAGISCTLWDDYAMKFLNYNHQRQTDDPIIIMLANAMIKKAKGENPASISNSYFGTKLFINDEIPEIQNFKISLGANEYVQSSEQYRFKFDAHVKSISEIVGISSAKEVTCVTVGTTAMFIMGEEGWYYEGCMKCTKKADVPNVPYQCTTPECLNYNETTIPRYKLDIKVVHEQGSAKFVFWDHQCAEIIGMTALELRDRMIQEGEDDLKAYPQPLDLMLTRTMAFRVKVQPVYNQSCVNNFSEDRQLIKHILDQIESTHQEEADIQN